MSVFGVTANEVGRKGSQASKKSADTCRYAFVYACSIFKVMRYCRCIRVTNHSNVSFANSISPRQRHYNNICVAILKKVCDVPFLIPDPPANFDPEPYLCVSVMCDVHNTLVNTVISKYGTQEQQDKWLPQLSTSKVRRQILAS